MSQYAYGVRGECSMKLEYKSNGIYITLRNMKWFIYCDINMQEVFL